MAANFTANFDFSQYPEHLDPSFRLFTYFKLIISNSFVDKERPHLLNGWKFLRFPCPVGEPPNPLLTELFPAATSSLIKFGNLECSVSFMPSLPPHLNGSLVQIEGFVEAAHCFGPAVLSKHAICTDSVAGSVSSTKLLRHCFRK